MTETSIFAYRLKRPGPTCFTSCAVAAAAAAALALGMAVQPARAAAPTPPGGIATITGTFDFGAADGSQERQASTAILESFPSAPAVIYLDVSIAPQVDATDPQHPRLDFKTQLFGPDGKILADPGCRPDAAHLYGADVSYMSVGTSALYPHLTLSISTAEGSAAPYNFLACAYVPALPGQAVLRVAGFFVVQEVTLPNSREVRLMPLNPPYEKAIDALQRSHSDP